MTGLGIGKLIMAKPSTIVWELKDQAVVLGSNAALVGKWLRCRKGWGIKDCITEGEIYLVHSCSVNNAVDIYITDEEGDKRVCHMGRFEHINPETLTPAEEYALILWQINKEVNEGT